MNTFPPIAASLLLVVIFTDLKAAGTPQELPLVQKSNFTYLGAFALPQGDFGASRFGYGGHGLTHYLDPVSGKHTLFMEGHAWFPGNVAQVEIPADAKMVKSNTWSDLQQAPVLQPFADITDGKIDSLAGSTSFVYGMLVYNGRLIVGASCFYDGDGSQRNSHGVSGMILSQGTDFKGFYPVTALANPRSLGGYMTTIPAQWQTLFGGPALTGKGCLSIISNNSAGPCATVFDPNDVGVKNPIPGTTLIFYPLSNPLAVETTQNNLFNLATHMAGIAFPLGSRSVLFFGRQGTGPYCYGTGSECSDPVDDSKGTHSYPYRHQVWAYDANDLLQVKNGQKQCWEMRPYAVWSMDEMNSDSSADMNGAGFDPQTGRLYITDDQGEEPHVHVYQVTVPGDNSVVLREMPARKYFRGVCTLYNLKGQVVAENIGVSHGRVRGLERRLTRGLFLYRIDEKENSSTIKKVVCQ
jgi:hypothetical protein